MWTDDFGSVGTRTGANGPGNFLVAGPKWNGTASAGVKDIFRSAIRYAWLLAQMSAASPQDFPAIHKLQNQLRPTPLSAWGSPYTPPANVPVDPTIDTTATPYDLLRLMTGKPPQRWLTQRARYGLAIGTGTQHDRSHCHPAHR
jgi:hypothetical protein